MSKYHSPRAGAILLALLFLSGTTFVLFEDVLRHGASVNVGHVLTALAFIGTTAACHYAGPEWRAGRYPMAAGLSIMIVAGTAYIATSSGARNAEVSGAKAAARAARNDARHREIKQLAEAQAMHRAASDRVAAECRSGDGPRCRGSRATEAVYSAAIAGHNARLAGMPEQPVNGGYAHAARVIATLPFVTANSAELEERLALLLPFVVVAIAELGSALFVGMALRAPDALASLQTSFANPSTWDTPPPSFDPNDDTPRGRKSRQHNEEARAKVIAFRQGYIRVHGTPPSARKIQAATGVAKSSAWRYSQSA